MLSICCGATAKICGTCRSLTARFGCGRLCRSGVSDFCIVDHVEQDGEGLFRLACQHDLEGVVAKWKSGQYLPQEPSSWVRIRNRNYSQWVGREELFEKERGYEAA
jgi:hypothetical protein